MSNIKSEGVKAPSISLRANTTTPLGKTIQVGTFIETDGKSKSLIYNRVPSISVEEASNYYTRSLVSNVPKVLTDKDGEIILDGVNLPVFTNVEFKEKIYREGIEVSLELVQCTKNNDIIKANSNVLRERAELGLDGQVLDRLDKSGATTVSCSVANTVAELDLQKVLDGVDPRYTNLVWIVTDGNLPKLSALIKVNDNTGKREILGKEVVIINGVASSKIIHLVSLDYAIKRVDYSAIDYEVIENDSINRTRRCVIVKSEKTFDVQVVDKNAMRTLI